MSNNETNNPQFQVNPSACDKKQKVTAKARWKQLTYGLIYPAFFGNMVYDFVVLLRDISLENILSVCTVGILLLFYTLDYVHLNVDLEFTASEEKKGVVYMFCDMAISFLFFIAVVFIKYSSPQYALISICIVPILFAWYNIKLGFNVKFHKILAVQVPRSSYCLSLFHCHL